MFGSWHLGQLQVGLSKAIRLAQCRSLSITLRQALPVQVDGEPWKQSPATMHISLRGQVTRGQSGEVGKAIMTARGRQCRLQVAAGSVA